MSDNKKVISDKGLDAIKQYEGLSLKAYQDVVGKWTIGYGHLIKLPEEKGLLDYPITEHTATSILKDDVCWAEGCVNAAVKVDITQGQFDALVSFVFNLGCGSLQRSTLLALLNKGEYLRAADQFLVWNKAGGKEVKGLTIRRTKEREMFLNE
jgi:lysozyme